jgi:hypothetical protein
VRLGKIIQEPKEEMLFQSLAANMGSCLVAAGVLWTLVAGVLRFARGLSRARASAAAHFVPDGTGSATPDETGVPKDGVPSA